MLMNRNEIGKPIDVAVTLMARDYKGFGNQMMNGVIERQPASQNNCSRDYEPCQANSRPCESFIERRDMPGTTGNGLQRPAENHCYRADGIYIGVTEKFQRGPLKDISRAIKATQHDAGVVLYGDTMQMYRNADRREMGQDERK